MKISENSRVWIYQANRPFTAAEQQEIESLLHTFTGEWLAHGHQLAAQAEVRYNRFIILMVDEAQAGATGCSIDKSVQLMKQIEQQYHVDLFDRLNIAFRQNGEVLSCSRDEFEQRIAAGEVNENTVVFNNLVQTRKELDTNWEVPFKNSWHARVFTGVV
ncbi:ABC transporter ATPase [Pedobacter sp. SYSU D00535]|uniref:ABC transporter ATPase n=1 Tax=Pedobacter sp. SYSU D00535 TaxID=2810308 RepID=UPI001A97A196|nr:ABC transporter ATPase [Pedobacter sp. SYSU D00535]